LWVKGEQREPTAFDQRKRCLKISTDWVMGEKASRRLSERDANIQTIMQ